MSSTPEFISINTCVPYHSSTSDPSNQRSPASSAASPSSYRPSLASIANSSLSNPQTEVPTVHPNPSLSTLASVVDSAIQGIVILETCHQYDDGVDIDSNWKSARAFSTMALIIGGLITFWALLSTCLFYNKQMYRSGGGLFILCCLFQGLTLLFLDSNACNNNIYIEKVKQLMPAVNLQFEDTCSMGSGAKCAIAATVMWFVTGMVSLKVNPPQHDPVMVETHDVTYTQTINPEDGTALVTETVVTGEPTVAD
ncbi:predicted protein [Thalassiosira pseudonana CCMP1335]|uniref:Uncharacterized protein n=1 Tax=Thalassiosira pseudonana TaxID=35128 RepID=B8C6Q9_THAPS|nr:predicted protein [Thalassiosira pseudonana CCMP1335]EED90614.1 predicted protein [Thalassiosira pseudonana CCMP1335]